MQLKSKIILIIGILILCSGFAMNTGFFRHQETPVEVISKYLEINDIALNQGKIKDEDLRWIVRHYTSPYYGSASAERAKSYAKTREAYIKTGGDIRQKIVEIKLHKQEDCKAVVFAEISTDILVDGEWMGNKGVILFSLVKQEGIWKIDHIGE